MDLYVPTEHLKFLENGSVFYLSLLTLRPANYR